MTIKEFKERAEIAADEGLESGVTNLCLEWLETGDY